MHLVTMVAHVYDTDHINI